MDWKKVVLLLSWILIGILIWEIQSKPNYNPLQFSINMVLENHTDCNIQKVVVSFPDKEIHINKQQFSKNSVGVSHSGLFIAALPEPSVNYEVSVQFENCQPLQSPTRAATGGMKIFEYIENEGVNQLIRFSH